jgi:hypothetical protein
MLLTELGWQRIPKDYNEQIIRGVFRGHPNEEAPHRLRYDEVSAVIIWDAWLCVCVCDSKHATGVVKSAHPCADCRVGNPVDKHYCYVDLAYDVA